MEQKKLPHEMTFGETLLETIKICAKGTFLVIMFLLTFVGGIMLDITDQMD